MILKDSHQSTVTQEGELVIKIFKPEYEFHMDDYEKFKNTCNQFSEMYGHFPKIIECDINKIIMEKVEGKSFQDFRKESLQRDIEDQFQDFRKMQCLYFKFISNLFEFNLTYNVSLIHNDLHYGNLLINDDKLICVDIDSVILNRNPAENSFMSFPIPVFEHDAERLNHVYYTMLDKKQKELDKKQVEINKEHRNVISDLKEKLGKKK